MHRLLIAVALVSCATLCGAAPSVRECTSADPVPTRRALDEHGQPLKLDKCWRYADRTGEYQLYLLHSADRQEGDDLLSKSLAAQLFRKQADGTLASQWVIHDKINESEAGAWFSKRLTEFADLDGDGVITPILVLRFVSSGRGEPGEPVDDGPFAGRLKFVLFHGDTKIAVRAVTGMLDDERHTTATESFFAMPLEHQRYLQRKMRILTKEEVFVFDDTGDFLPKHERPAPPR